MGEKRKDSKGRNLRTGESQRKDGRYCYAYTLGGKQMFVYSWKLEPYDTTPSGKRDDICLRDKIRALNDDAVKGIVRRKCTVLQLAKDYISTRNNVKRSTKNGYKFVIGVLEKETFALKDISSIKPSDAKKWLCKLQATDKRSYSTIGSIRGVLKPAFAMAVMDGELYKNPFDFPLSSVIFNDGQARFSITESQETKLLDFIKHDGYYCRYYDAIYILLNTGLRIGELCGLTIDDIDFKAKTITVKRQLQRVGKNGRYIDTPKTKTGIRELPMTTDVAEAFSRIISSRPSLLEEPTVDGVSGFLILDMLGQPTTPLHWEHHFKYIRDRFNEVSTEKLPSITPHICRHTYCTRMANKGVNPKTLQYLMGHSDIGVTLNVYTHVNLDDVKNELSKFGY